MSLFVTSKGTRIQHVAPKYQSRPYRPSPARREAIHGPIRPLADEPGVGGRVGLAVLLIATVAIGFMLFAPLFENHAASVSSSAPQETGSSVPLVDARGNH